MIDFRLDGSRVVWTHTCTYLDHDGTFEHTETLPVGAWIVQQTDPLTVVPSILCGYCGTHGFITDGKWVPA